MVLHPSRITGERANSPVGFGTVEVEFLRQRGDPRRQESNIFFLESGIHLKVVMPRRSGHDGVRPSRTDAVSPGRIECQSHGVGPSEISSVAREGYWPLVSEEQFVPTVTA